MRSEEDCFFLKYPQLLLNEAVLHQKAPGAASDALREKLFRRLGL